MVEAEKRRMDLYVKLAVLGLVAGAISSGTAIDGSGRCIGGISVTGLVTEIPRPQVVARPVVQAAKALSALL